MKIILDNGQEIDLQNFPFRNLQFIIDNTQGMIEILEKEHAKSQELTELLWWKISIARQELDGWLQLKDIMDRRQRQFNEIINPKGNTNND